MNILDVNVKEFQGLYLKHFGEKLTKQDARFLLAQLVRQMQIVYQPISLSKLDKYIEKCTARRSKDERQNHH